MNRAALVCAAFFSAACLITSATEAGSQEIATSAPRDGSPVIALKGVTAGSGYIWYKSLRTLPVVIVTVSQQTDKGPTNATFKGALLWTVINRAGWVNGSEKNAYIRHTILVTGKDGYAAALSEGELDPKLEGKQVILAYEKDGQALDLPRLVVPGDAHASRGVHDVVSVVVQ